MYLNCCKCGCHILIVLKCLLWLIWPYEIVFIHNNLFTTIFMRVESFVFNGVCLWRGFEGSLCTCPYCKSFQAVIERERSPNWWKWVKGLQPNVRGHKNIIKSFIYTNRELNFLFIHWQTVKVISIFINFMLFPMESLTGSTSAFVCLW